MFAVVLALARRRARVRLAASARSRAVVLRLPPARSTSAPCGSHTDQAAPRACRSSILRLRSRSCTLRHPISPTPKLAAFSSRKKRRSPGFGRGRWSLAVPSISPARVHRGSTLTLACAHLHLAVSMRVSVACRLSTLISVLTARSHLAMRSAAFTYRGSSPFRAIFLAASAAALSSRDEATVPLRAVGSQYTGSRAHFTLAPRIAPRFHAAWCDRTRLATHTSALLCAP